jgi:hypothetical protein
MPRLETLKAARKALVRALAAVTLAALVAFHVTEASAQGDARLWSVVIHFEYQDGTEYDYVLATGVSTSDMAAMMRECGASHSTGSVVRYHCFAIPE